MKKNRKYVMNEDKISFATKFKNAFKKPFVFMYTKFNKNKNIESDFTPKNYVKPFKDVEKKPFSVRFKNAFKKPFVSMSTKINEYKKNREMKKEIFGKESFLDKFKNAFKKPFVSMSTKFNEYKNVRKTKNESLNKEPFSVRFKSAFKKPFIFIANKFKKDKNIDVSNSLVASNNNSVSSSNTRVNPLINSQIKRPIAQNFVNNSSIKNLPSNALVNGQNQNFRNTVINTEKAKKEIKKMTIKQLNEFSRDFDGSNEKEMASKRIFLISSLACGLCCSLLMLPIFLPSVSVKSTTQTNNDSAINNDPSYNNPTGGKNPTNPTN